MGSGRVSESLLEGFAKPGHHAAYLVGLSQQLLQALMAPVVPLVD